MHNDDTIVALSSGGLPSGIAVIRVSGALVNDVMAALLGSAPSPRQAELKTIRHADGSVLDKGLVLFFPAPHSFTGEDCVELHVHGGRAVVKAVIDAVCALHGCRPADPGEFMRRAFLHGKTDLLGAEAVADLISAETEAQRRFAICNAGGGNAALYAGWRTRLVRLRAMIEAGLDFADESDVAAAATSTVDADALLLLSEMRSHIGGFKRAEIIRHGLDVVIVGPPNSGKSSLLNALAGRDVAIVSDEAGTTRDLIEIALDLNGHKVRLTDSAGLREGGSRIEAIGIGRALARASQADLVLRLQPCDAIADLTFMLDPAVASLRIRSKCDLLSAGHVAEGDLLVSVKTGEGLAALLKTIEDRAADLGARAELSPWRSRHVDLLGMASDALEACLVAGLPSELVAENLRAASVAIGRISGSVDVEDLLDVIFSQFCIGK